MGIVPIDSPDFPKTFEHAYCNGAPGGGFPDLVFLGMFSFVTAVIVLSLGTALD